MDVLTEGLMSVEGKVSGEEGDFRKGKDWVKSGIWAQNGGGAILEK